MSWAHGIDAKGRDVGYAVFDICNQRGCDVEINRGISYRCGGTTNLHEDFGCGDFVCVDDLFYVDGAKDSLCRSCADEWEKDHLAKEES